MHKAIAATGVGLSDLGYFDNLLHHDPVIRKKGTNFMLRVFETAALLERISHRVEHGLGRDVRLAGVRQPSIHVGQRQYIADAQDTISFPALL